MPRTVTRRCPLWVSGCRGRADRHESVECGTAEWAARCTRHVGAAQVSALQKIDPKAVACSAAECVSCCPRRAAAETTPVAVHTQINTRSVECSTAEWAARCARHARAGQVSTAQKIGHGLLACVLVLRRPLVRDSDTVNWPWYTCLCAPTQAPSGQRFRYRKLAMVYLPVYSYSGALWSEEKQRVRRFRASTRKRLPTLS